MNKIKSAPWMPMVVVFTVIVFAIFFEDFSRHINEKIFNYNLKNDYTLIDYNFETSNDIEFTGYKGKPCSINLKENFEQLGLVTHYTFNMGMSIAYKKDGKLYVANYIKEYATKEEVLNYISLCEKEIQENITKEATQLKINKESWDSESFDTPPHK